MRGHNQIVATKNRSISPVQANLLGEKGNCLKTVDSGDELIIVLDGIRACFNGR